LSFTSTRNTTPTPHHQVFNVPGRCYPVDIIHAHEDHAHDYVSAAVDTVLQIHTRQPAGEALKHDATSPMIP
jgi:HrpA-like RNA helicase